MRQPLPSHWTTPGLEPTREVTKRQVSRPRQVLIELMQARNYGWIENIVVRACEPIVEPLPIVITEVKFDGEHGPRQELALDDFVLKSKHLQLFACLDRLKDGIIQRLDFKQGLPFRMVVKESAT